MASKNETIKRLNSDFIRAVTNTLDDASKSISEIYARRKMTVAQPEAPMAPPMPMQAPAMPDPIQAGPEQTQSDPSQAGQAVNAFLSSADMSTQNLPQPQGMQPSLATPQMEGAGTGQQPTTDDERMQAVQQFSQQTGQDPVSIVESIISGNLKFVPGQGIINPGQMGNMPPMM
jgi:hypothetical protein|tara:strand:- start:362 stop:883 length:522 start_codon:yes stop_codon:yes gene_type:complete